MNINSLWYVTRCSLVFICGAVLTGKLLQTFRKMFLYLHVVSEKGLGRFCGRLLPLSKKSLVLYKTQTQVPVLRPGYDCFLPLLI
jgi:hypothetical protein